MAIQLQSKFETVEFQNEIKCSKGIIDVVVQQLSYVTTEFPDQDLSEMIVEPEYILEGLNLHGDTPDGLTLIGRFMGGKNLEGDMMQVWLYDRPLAKKLIRLRNFIEKEIKIPGEAGHVFSVHQEQILRNMALIFDKQISRERNICPVAQEFAMALLKCRPEYLSTETCKLLAEDTVTLNMIIPQFFLTEML